MNRIVVLDCQEVVELFPRPPFHFDATLHKPDHFPAADNAWEPGVRWQTMLWQNLPLGLKLENRGTVDHPRITLSIWWTERLTSDFWGSLKDEIHYRYNWQLDLTEFIRRFRKDAVLAPIIDRWHGMRPLNYSSLYEYLIIAIILQNATVRRSVTMMQNLFENYGTPLAFDGKELYSFWAPEALSHITEQDLRELKLGYRAKAIKRVTEVFASGALNEMELRDQPKDVQRRDLLALYGIGPASVGYILSDVFHHLDELEHISPWEQRIYSKLFFDTPPNDPVPVDTLLNHFKERFGKYRMLAVHYVWEDLFWRWKHEGVTWLDKLIRL